MIDQLESFIEALSRFVFWKMPLGPVQVEAIVLFLAVPMLFFTAWLGFPNLRALGISFRIVRGRYADPDAPGEISQFAALATALSGTVGLGNIAGVAIAVSTGGPGAAFWMFVIGFFAMTLKCAEVALGLKYREYGPGGAVFGGPMYTIKNGLAARGLPRLGLALGGIYAFLALFGAIPLVQVNQSYAQVASVTGLSNPWIYGAIMAVLVAAVVLGGARWLGRVTSRLVPAMALVYLTGVLAILLLNWPLVPGALEQIVASAFTGQAAAGGALGSFIIGMRRAVYSSEAGIGSAVIAHAQARTREPVSEGFVALLEPFVDTVIINSLGALALVVAGTWASGLEGVAITSAAFATVAPWFPAVLAVAVFLFGYSTLVAWGFYGLQAWGYLWGHGHRAAMLYKLLYVVLLPIGAVLPLGKVVDLIDSAFFLMAVPNIAMLYVCAGELRRDVRDYWARHSNPRQAPLEESGRA